MNKSEYHILLDLHEQVSGAILFLKRGDSARRVSVTLTEAGEPYKLTQPITAYLSVKLPDGTADFRGMMRSGNVLFLDIPEAWTAAAGEIECEVVLEGNLATPDDKVYITSPRFGIQILDKLSFDPTPVIFAGVYGGSISGIDFTAAAESVKPGAEAQTITLTPESGNVKWYVAVPMSANLTPTFACSVSAPDPGKTTDYKTDLHDRRMLYDIYTTIMSPGTWTVTIPAKA